MTGNILPIVRTLSVMLTHKCNAECTHCGTLSGPRVGGRADLDSVLSAIREAADVGFGNVVFTGGEPTIYFEDLLEGIREARRCGLGTRVVTNAGWSKSRRKAEKKLNQLVEAGLDEINFSTGDEHQRFVPLEDVVTGIVTALDLEIPIHLMVEKVKARSVTKAAILAMEPLASHPRLERLGVSESPWMPLDPFSISEYDQGTTANAGNVAYFAGCDSVLQTYVLHPAGEVTSCCGIGARVIGELRAESNYDASDPDSLGRIIEEAEEDFLKLWMRQEGPEKILHWAAGFDPSIRWENQYAHRCQACARVYKDAAVRKVIREHYEEKIADVLGRSYIYEHVSQHGIPQWKSQVSTDSGLRAPSPQTAA